MVTKFNVGDEFTLKVKVANIFTDRSGTTYMLTVVANNGENLAGNYFNYREETLERIVGEISRNTRTSKGEVREAIDEICGMEDYDMSPEELNRLIDRIADIPESYLMTRDEIEKRLIK